jgi:hypothetical protein
MKKLKLDLDTIEVLSFPTTASAEAMEGTVHAAGVTISLCGKTCRGGSVCCETA